MSRSTVQSRSIAIITITPFVSLGITSLASAQALPGEVLKFQQLPLGDLQTNPKTPAPGHDELSTAMLNTSSQGYSGTFAADDFSDNLSSPVVDVEWWGSYLPNTAQPGSVQQFLISFESDVPVGPAGGFSHPGNVLSSEVVTLGALTPQSGTFTETPVASLPGPDGQLYQYNAELTNPFPEQADTVYWLKIVALTTPSQQGLQWGWHNRDYTIPDPYAAPVLPGEVNLGPASNPIWHFQDDAVSGLINYVPGSVPQEGNFAPLSYNTTSDGFGGTGVTPPSEDLAFELYTVPEPVGLPLLAGGLFLMRRRRHA
jgi:hypothetical protein